MDRRKGNALSFWGAVMKDILSTQALLTVLNGLEEEARGGGPVCLAIVNRSGRLAALLAQDGTPERAIPIAQSKAYTALRMESSTRDFHERLLRERLTLADFCDSAFTTLEGGIPLFDENGKCVGGLGISGRKPTEDGELAERLRRILTDAPEGDPSGPALIETPSAKD